MTRSHGHTGRSCSGAAALALLLTAIFGRPALAADWPEAVEATYQITFLGMPIGDFRFTSKIDGDRYTIESRSKIKVLLGAFKWRGAFDATGRVGDRAPVPERYSYVYRGSKDGSVKFQFAEDRARDILVDPAKPPSKSAVPLKDEHLKGVLDPLSAIMAISRFDRAKPCDRTFALFDGKQRFDLSLTRHAAGKAASANGTHLCRVVYTPIAGHKPNKENTSLANGTILIALKPVSSAGIAVPQSITMPTAWGEAALIAKKIEVTAGGKKQIAFVSN